MQNDDKPNNELEQDHVTIPDNNTYMNVQPYQHQRLSVASNSSATIECRNVLERRQSRTSQSGLPDFPTSTVPPSMTPTIIPSSNHQHHPHHSSYTLPPNLDSKVAQRSASTTPFISYAHSSTYKHQSNHVNVKTRHSLSKFKTQQIEYPMDNKGEIRNII